MTTVPQALSRYRSSRVNLWRRGGSGIDVPFYTNNEVIVVNNETILANAETY